LYRSGSDSATETGAESVDDARTPAGEWPEIDENTEQDVVLEERLADEERQFGRMTRQSEAEATWGPDTESGGDNDQSGEYGRDWDAAPDSGDSELTRHEEADATWGPADGTGSDDGTPAEQGLSRQEEAETTRASAPDGTDSSPAITHYHSDYKGGTLDLYTDGTRWAAWDDSMPRAPDLVAPDDEAIERAPAGEELVEMEGGKASMLDRLRSETYRESEDITDTLQDDTNLAHDVFARPPTSSYEGTPSNHPFYVATPQPGIDAGTMATALFVVGLGAERGVNWAMEHYKQHTRGDEHGGDRRTRRGTARRTD
jgi:hypothetical protein